MITRRDGSVVGRAQSWPAGIIRKRERRSGPSDGQVCALGALCRCGAVHRIVTDLTLLTALASRTASWKTERGLHCAGCASAPTKSVSAPILVQANRRTRILCRRQYAVRIEQNDRHDDRHRRAGRPWGEFAMTTALMAR
jgi:hypothetical protein